ncbi:MULTISPECIES: non-heme iron oxygenase ferredoxin subunit [Pseudomonas]|jgi:nitrite reductase/ring-hydroxylating ferredoxin subunit|uniref:non-heme iron oxygenase ferredoxin subunit n=1 Tax=Pseudomonas TaxID=286 RepID=UPI00073044B3|nr:MULTISPECIES: non-heme iron oxygenase ferredoxin subunit [Pseudomonas]KSW27704.1 Rieske (2Fe-2S) domain-containing protein [Pseudomonas sp. ADP]OBP07152.1 Rieske (2Fe-2S) domain-containing protein [Pseudomonas sp. EGD-AKN5]QOF84371.1 non-heme iron oxygenase ferredoxin subunit [Pseudomonas sp. ADPe]WBG62125.1 non-heme iron oxygenase ferredoxin subunit [Pseudomonas citronellolis]
MSVREEDWAVACRVDEVGDEQARRVQIGDQAIAVFNLGGCFHALADRCPHGDASLAEGWIENGEVECPLHQARFDIATGKVLCAPAKSCARRYPVKVENDVVLIGLFENTLQIA